MATPAAADIFIELQEAHRMAAATGDAGQAGSGQCGRQAMESTGAGNSGTDGNALSQPLGKFTIGDFNDERAVAANNGGVGDCATNHYRYRYYGDFNHDLYRRRRHLIQALLVIYIT